MWEPNDVQKRILLKLLTVDRLRYSEIQPKNIANDLFNYHLQFLLKKNLIEKKDNTYNLSTKGVKYLEEIKPISRSDGFTQNFRVSVLYIVLNKSGKEKTVLLQKRTRKPFLGNVEIPGGKLFKGELVEDATQRICFRETGLSCAFKKIGLFRGIRYFNNELFSDGFWFVCLATEQPQGSFENISAHGENMWVSLTEAIEIEKTSVTRSDYMIKLLTALSTSDNQEFEDAFTEEICKLPHL